MSSSEIQIGKGVEASTVGSAGKARRPVATVYYDGNCMPCRHLAQLISKSTPTSELVVIPTSESEPAQLVVEVGDDRYVGRDAWSWLLEHHTMFREWNWLATKLGLQDEAVTFVMRGAEVLRRLCPTCRRSRSRST